MAKNEEKPCSTILINKFTPLFNCFRESDFEYVPQITLANIITYYFFKFSTILMKCSHSPYNLWGSIKTYYNTRQRHILLITRRRKMFYVIM